VIIVAVSLLVVWRFLSFYLLAKEDDKSRKRFYFLCGLLVVFVAAAVFAKNKYNAQWEKVFSSPFAGVCFRMIVIPVREWLKQFWWGFASLSALAVAVEIFFRRQLTKKESRHGPDFGPGAAGSDGDGIMVGRFDRDILPKQARIFAPKISSGIFIPCNRLSRGITILGDMGSGKSRLMSIIYCAIREKYPNIPILLHDPKGEWLRTYYDLERDLIFAPFDRRSASWTMWEDFKKIPELRHPVISTAVEAHHSGHGGDRFWSDSGVLLLKDAAAQDNIALAKKKIIKLRGGKQDDVTWQSIYTTALIGFRDLASVELMNALGGGVSMNYFLNYPGNIFLLNNPGIASEQHGALTLFLAAFMMRVLSGADTNNDSELRAAVILDEALTFHLPEDVERAVYTQSRSKGLAIIASAQRLPKENQGERGAWSDHPAHIFAMKTSDLNTRQILAKRVGNITYDEKQKSVSVGDKSNSQTESMTQRHHDVIAPEDWALEPREFILFHETGVAPGRVKDIESKQRDIKIIDYDPRSDITAFMEGL